MPEDRIDTATESGSILPELGGSGGEQSTVNEEAVKNEIYRYLLLHLDYDYDVKRSEFSSKIKGEILSDLIHRRTWRTGILIIAVFAPFVILGAVMWIVWTSLSADGAVFGVPHAIVISASIFAFVAVYAMLLKSMYGGERQREDTPPASLQQSWDVFKRISSD